MTDVANAAGNPASEKPSIEDTMGAVFDKMNTEPSAESAPAVPLPEDAGLPSVEHESEPPAPSSHPDRLRGPDGKFIEKPKAEVAPVAKTEAAPVPTDPAVTAAAPQPTLSAPTSWAADKRALFDKADPSLREYIATREKQQIEGVAKLKAEYEGKLGSLAPIAEALRPVEARLRLHGVQPAQYVSRLAQADEMLRTNGQAAIVELARMYGIDLGGLQTGGYQGQQAPVDPILAATQQRLGQLESFLQGQLRQQQEAETAQLTSQIEAFKSDPKNVHFEDVRADMAALIQAGRAKDLETAYDMAIHANPTVRARVLETQRAADDAKRAEEAAKKATEARRIAATNVATKGTVGASPSTPKSMEETMRQTYDRIHAA